MMGCCVASNQLDSTKDGCGTYLRRCALASEMLLFPASHDVSDVSHVSQITQIGDDAPTSAGFLFPCLQL